MVPIVIYDAECRFCEASRQGIERWARKGRRPVALRFVHYEEPEAIRLQPDLDAIGCLNAFRFLDEEGRVSIGAAAAVQIVKRLPGGRPLAWLMALPGVWRLTVWSYQWIAANRYRWFGKTER